MAIERNGPDTVETVNDNGIDTVIFRYVLTATWDLLSSRAKLCGEHVVLLEEPMNLLNQSE